MCPGPRPAVMSRGYVTTAGEKFSWLLVNKFKTLRRCCRIFLLFNSLTGWSGVTSVAHAWAGCLCCNLKKKKKKDRSSSILTWPWTNHGSRHPTSVAEPDPTQSPNFVGLNLDRSDLASTVAQSGLVFCRTAWAPARSFSFSSPSRLRGTLANIPRSVSDGLWCQRVLQPRQNILVYFRRCWSKNWQNPLTEVWAGCF